MGVEQEMNIVLTLTPHNRPHYLRRVLDSIKANDYAGTSLVVARDNASEAVNQIIDEIDWIPTIVRDTSLGAHYSNRYAYRVACIEGADYVIAIEDDTVLSADCIKMVRWFAQSGSGAMNCFSHSKTFARPNDVRFAIQFCPWVWAFKASFFWDVLQPHWMEDARGWDFSMLGVFKKYGIHAMEPILSRSENIGREGGLHYTPALFDEHFSGHVMSDGSMTDYTLTA